MVGLVSRGGPDKRTIMNLGISRRSDEPRPGGRVRLSILCVNTIWIMWLAIWIVGRGEAAETTPLFVWGPQQVGFAIGYGEGVKFADSGTIQAHRAEELILLAHWQMDFTLYELDAARVDERVVSQGERRCAGS